jgi:hypothetical protein
VSKRESNSNTQPAINVAVNAAARAARTTAVRPTARAAAEAKVQEQEIYGKAYPSLHFLIATMDLARRSARRARWAVGGRWAVEGTRTSWKGWP